MLLKIGLTLILFALCFFTLQVMEQKVAPQHATSLVIEGVNQPELMADNQAQARIEQNSQNMLDPVAYLIAFVLFMLIWMKDIKNVFESFVTEEVEYLNS